jgi:NADPH-dependent 2,4-dienoyl-CoA reductase/sulfur reductase-like enzyme
MGGLDPAGRVVVVGGSIAALSAVRELRTAGFAGAVTVVDADPDVPYRRPDVSKGLLAAPPGRRTQLAWTPELAVNVLTPASALGLDLAARTVTVRTEADVLELNFDGLVIATGAGSRRLPFLVDGDSVHQLRSMADAARLRAALESARRLGVIGGGLIGLEVAAHVAARGLPVTVLEADARPLERVVGTEVASFVIDLLGQRGVELRASVSVESITEPNAAPRVTLADGSQLIVDQLLVAVGAIPNTTWLAGSGLDLVDGVRCDEHGRVIAADARPLDHVVACGDVARWQHPLLGGPRRIEHWNNALEQGAHAARTLLAGPSESGFESVPYFWSDQGELRLQLLGSGPWDAVVTEQKGPAELFAEYFDGDELVAVGGVGGGAAVMSRRADVLDGLRRRAASRSMLVGRR